ncbi:IS256 family transposase [Caldifermentibacillus hisashii]|uniref:IS256 family transposase n=1 Tax=Caldifermentibacillus hisashii TaxID=996558 RepID=UPI000BA3518C|nr:IS256 family transposase [Caldifermentibacillus hisashii]PAC34389.1 IS256 family transposase [Caldifermentibacillus hisashii]
MNHLTTDLIEALAQKQDIEEVFRHHLETAINQLLKHELTVFLDYEPYDREGFHSGNSRNGNYDRTFKTEYGELHLRIPRDRNGEFQQQTIAPYKRSNDTLEQFVIHLYEKGITTNEIAHLIERMYGHHYSKQTVSNLTQLVSEDVQAFHERKLEERYVCIYLDATHIPIRRQTVEKEAVYIAIGITEEGNKEVLDFTIAPTESSHVWEELIQGLRERGVENVLLFISDGLPGMTDSIHRVYPKAKHQVCCVHVARNISSKVRVKDRAAILDDFKAVYQAKDREEALEALERMQSKWEKSYPRVIESVMNNEQILTFYDFPASIRRSIYSTNLIEAFNKEIKRYVKRKEQFPNEESLDRFLVIRFLDYNHKFGMRCHRGFEKAKSELIQMFEALED